MRDRRNCLSLVLAFTVLIHASRITPVRANHWGIVDEVFRMIANEILKFALPAAVNVSSNISPECTSSLLEVGVGLKTLKPWTIQMLDSMGKIPTGIMRGSFTNLGSYDQCLLVTATRRENEEIFIGQHCTVMLDIPWEILPNQTNLMEVLSSSSKLPLHIMNDPVVFNFVQGTVGVCVPSKCTDKDVRTLGNNLLRYYSIPSSVAKINCETRLKQTAAWTKAEIASGSFFGIIIILVIIGTTTDVALLWRENKNQNNDYQYQNKLVRAIRGFSFYSNAKRLAATDTASLKCMHGLRVISLLWVMLSHTYVLGFPHQQSINENAIGYQLASMDVFFALFDNASPSVDTFFFVSGFLIAYTTWKTLEAKNGSINVLKFLFRKYWRLTPSLCAAIALLLLLPMMSSGPLWKENVEAVSKVCEKNWWKNLIYVQNFFNLEEACLNHTWYIACLMQLTIIGIFLILLTFWRSWLGLTVGFALISAGATITIIFTGLYDLAPAPLYSSYGKSRVYNYLDYQLTKPHDHIGVYLIGMVAGYIVLKHRDIKIKRIFQILAWICSITLCLAVVFGAHHFRITRERGTLLASFHSGLHRTVWAFGIAWLVFACTTGRAELINSILSWYPFSFLARLSYMAYLLHFHVITYYTARRRTTTYFSYEDLAYCFIGHATVAFIISYFVHLIVEMPFSTLENVLLGKRQYKRPRISIDATTTKGQEDIRTISFKVQHEN